MVCVPCIILPVLLAIYVKFIQPLILRFVPDRWKAKFDAFLYPTCPIQKQPVNTTDSKEDEEETDVKDTADSTFDQSSTVEAKKDI